MAKILYIEDEERWVTIVEFILEQNSHEVIGCMTVEEGLIEARRSTYDLIICDDRILVEDGFALAVALSEQGHTTMVLSGKQAPMLYSRPYFNKNRISGNNLLNFVEGLLSGEL